MSNVFVHDDRISGLIDWEAGSAEGIPVLDAINYLGSVHRLFKKGYVVPRLVPLMASGKWPIADEWKWLMQRYARFGVDPSHYESLVYLNWLRNVTFRLPFRLIYDPAGINLYIHRVIPTLLHTEG